MGVPKHRTSKSRQKRRRAHQRLTPPTLVPCPRCRQPKPPHRICPHCGTYKGREILEPEG